MKIKDVKLLSFDLKLIQEFYHDILGLETNFNNDYIQIKIGNSTLQFKEDKNQERSKYHLAINIPSNQITSAKKWLEQKVTLIQKEGFNKIIDFVNWNAKSIYFYDLEDNILELIARKDLNVISSESFNSNQFIAISEVGIGTHDPLLFAQNMIEKFKLTYFEKDSPTNEFVALGNDEGLFVISSTNRNWFPTNNTVKQNPIVVEFESMDKIHTVYVNTKA